jgi:hypothetical protein
VRRLQGCAGAGHVLLDLRRCGSSVRSPQPADCTAATARPTTAGRTGPIASAPRSCAPAAAAPRRCPTRYRSWSSSVSSPSRSVSWATADAHRQRAAATRVGRPHGLGQRRLRPAAPAGHRHQGAAPRPAGRLRGPTRAGPRARARAPHRGLSSRRAPAGGLLRHRRLAGTKGVVWQHAAIDAASAFTWAELHVTPRKPRRTLRLKARPPCGV